MNSENFCDVATVDGEPFHPTAEIVDKAPSPACFGSGTVKVHWNVGCEQGGDCDPDITTFTMSSGITDLRSVCF